MCHQYHSSLSKREVTGHFKALNRQTEEHGKPREETIVITLNKVCKDCQEGFLRRGVLSHVSPSLPISGAVKKTSEVSL